MQQLSFDEVDAVSGALTMQGALNIIGGIAAVCAVVPGLQGAAAFAGGVYLGGTLAMEFAN